METTVSSEEDLVCQTCGDEGYTNAFIYCVRCLGFVIHRYCLPVMPDTYDEFVMWYCDDCEPTLPFHFISPSKYDSSQSQNEDPRNSALVVTAHPKKKQKRKSLKKRKLASLALAGKDNECISGPNKITRCVVLGLAKREHESLPSQEKVAASLQHVETTKHNKLRKKKQKKKRERVFLLEKDNISCLQETAKSNSEKRVETPLSSLLNEALVNPDSGANQITPQRAELGNNCFSMKGIVKRKRDTIRVAAKTKKPKTEKSIEHSSCESSCTDATLKNEEDITQTEEGLKCGPDHDTLVSNSSSTESQLNKRSKEFIGIASVSQSAVLENNIQYIDNQARPVLDPVWRGSFNITQTDYDLFEGFVGHISSKAGKKVYEEATTLSSMLSLEMHSKAHLWPKSFLHSMPSDESIALYFFPGETKNKEDFEQLVNDMIHKDLAMKATAKNAELLIFTSKLLPHPYCRFQGNHYLWGVFKGKRNDVPVEKPSDNHVMSAISQSEVTHEKEVVKRVISIDSHSPQSPLCSYR